MTDDYKRVFADNEGNIPNCRSCRAQSGSTEDDDEEGSEREVLLRDVAGDDTSETGSERAESASVRPSAGNSEGSGTSGTSADAGESEVEESTSGGARERIAGLFSSIRG